MVLLFFIGLYHWAWPVLASDTFAYYTRNLKFAFFNEEVTFELAWMQQYTAAIDDAPAADLS